MGEHIAYCESCEQLVLCEIQPPQEDTFPVGGVLITALQKHAYCPHCGSEVTPNEIIDFNVTNAHNAYLKKLGIPFAPGAKKPRELEEETMSNDLISRKALLERIEKDTPWWWQNFHSYLIVDMLKEAPVIEAEA